MKNILKLLVCLTTLASFSQKNFYETIASHGESAIYQRYYSVYKDDNGKQVIAGKQYQLKAEIVKFQDINAGFKLVAASKNDLAGIATIDVTKSKSHKIIGYPNVSLLVDRISRKGYVAINDYIFKLGNVWKEKDGIGFNDIDAIYIRVGAKGSEGKNTSGKKKKKKFGAFMNKLKDAAMNKTPSECTSPACKKAEGMDLKKFVFEYLQSMKVKQDAYTLTTKDKVDIAILKGAVDGYYKHVNEKNDAYWKIY
ncbi:hypothetical protein [Polaribacter sp. R77954]|uniref:hypothetical protein n=1 Tax=Polaribacter sp. R77954 TaxID=3093870 RepID=UPI0037CACE9B